MVEQQQQVRCLVDSGLTHEGGMSRVVGGPSGLPPPPHAGPGVYVGRGLEMLLRLFLKPRESHA